ncbi:MAG: glycosyltransferase family 2 protein [Gemmatimonadota bacterium]|nr:glycosyltransferase family 2 protein [Gemmatimonadota bacterium]
MRLSVVSTMYKSAPYLREFHARVSAAASLLTNDFEIILVNDGSPDESLDVAVALYGEDTRVRVVDLSRNFGHHKAMMTGLEYARGELVYLLDCDLEEEPELLGAFVKRMREEHADVVYGIQAQRKGKVFERITGAAYYRLFNVLSTQPIPANLITLRLMTRRYVQALVKHREREVTIGGLWAATGFRQVGFVITKHSRAETTYDLRRKISHVVNSITAFSSRPLVFIFYLGVGISLTAGLAALWMVLRRLFFGHLLAGWASLIVSVWLLGGLTLMCLGVIGIYLSKIFMETKQRPYTIVREVYEHAGPTRPTVAPSGRVLTHHVGSDGSDD